MFYARRNRNVTTFYEKGLVFDFQKILERRWTGVPDGKDRFGRVQVGEGSRWGKGAGGGMVQVGEQCGWGKGAGGGREQVGEGFRWGKGASGGKEQVGEGSRLVAGFDGLCR